MPVLDTARATTSAMRTRGYSEHVIPRFASLRGSDLNRRPLGYESFLDCVGNPCSVLTGGHCGSCQPTPGRRHGIAEPLRDGAARGFETRPFVSIMEAGKRNHFAPVEPDQGCIDHVFRRHDDRRGQVLAWEAGDFPGIGLGRGRQHCLNTDASIGELVLQ
jgi:hypothetical protein